MANEYGDFVYTEPGALNGQVGRNLAQKFVDVTRDLQGVERICDLGCGNGNLSFQLGACGFQVTGIDASASGVELATRHYASERVRFLRAEIGDNFQSMLPADFQFDAVVSCDVIEHLYRPAALIEAAGQLLSPGGYLIVGTPYHGYIKNLAISVLNRWDSHHGVHWDGGHIKFFSVRTLSDLVVRHGFELLAIYCHGRVPYLWKHMICVARKAR